MADLVNPYANPYLPAFVSQRPRFNDTSKPMAPLSPMSVSYSQIHSANGFAGAREYALNNLANGASEIISDTDPNIARVYIVAKDSTGMPFMEPYRLVPEEEPKPVTMDDLSAKMSELLDRMNKLEEDKKNVQSSAEHAVADTRQFNDAGSSTSGRNGQNFKEPSGGSSRSASK